MNIHEVLKDAPKYLAQRYGSLNKYVFAYLFPPEYRSVRLRIKDPKKRKEREEKMKLLTDEASLYVFIYVVRKTLTEGSRAAKDAVDVFKSLGVNGFRLGRAEFSGRNENVMLGENLANKMNKKLSLEVDSALQDAIYMYQILDKYKELR